MKAAIALAATVACAVLVTLALYRAMRWLVALRSAPTGPVGLRDAEWTRLTDERRRLLNHLREIDFDRDTGKLDLADYEQLRARYEFEALGVLADMDRLRPPGSAPAHAAALDHASAAAAPAQGPP